MDTTSIQVWDVMNPPMMAQHECEFLSQCCGAGHNEYVVFMCNACNEATGFECIYCEKLEE